MRRITQLFIVVIFTLLLTSIISTNNEMPKMEENKMNYTMPSESLLHEGTWLTWPHQYSFGIKYQKEIESILVQITQALHTGEKVHIVAYDKAEQIRIEKLLLSSSVDMQQIDIVIAKSNDVWVRDTGPMFVLDKFKKLTIADFGFDGWGEKAKFANDDKIPLTVGIQKKIPITDISAFVLEGGSIELDGNGTLMASLSSVVSKNRNKGLTILEAERYLSKYLGATNFIWLNGVTDEDITDAHIDGIARFIDDRTILTVSEDNFTQLYENICISDYKKIQNARNVNGIPYKIVEIPLTKNNAKGLNYKGSYLNYYIGNEVVLVPVYNDPFDDAALKIIANIYPERKIVPINVNALFKYGGMIHCITQQQPLSN